MFTPLTRYAPHFSLLCIGLAWLWPFLHYTHQYPITTFYQEWWGSLFGLLALSALAVGNYWQQAQTPRIILLPLALIALIAVQYFNQQIPYLDQATLFALYLLFAAVMMLLGAKLRDDFGLEKLATVLAIFLVIGCELNAFIGFIQHFRWDTPINSYTVVKISAGVYGNIAQPNHFSNYLSLGLISLGLLLQQRKLHPASIALLAAPLLITMTLSGSRSSWLYLVLITLLAGYASWKNREFRPLLKYGVSLIVAFALCHWLTQLPFMSSPGGNTSSIDRTFINPVPSGDIRLYLWQEALTIFQQNPWLGAGFGQFAQQHFQLLPTLRGEHISGLYNNTHNIVLHFLAETGLVGTLILFATFLAWLIGINKSIIDAAHWWAYAALGVLAIHSLLEYPLWYIYFIGIAAFLLGCMDGKRYQLKLPSLGRFSVLCVLLIGLITLTQLRQQYQQLENILITRHTTNEEAFKQNYQTLTELHKGSLLVPYVELLIASFIEIDAQHLDSKLALNTRVFRYSPISLAAYNQALLLTQAGQTAQSQLVLEQSIWSYPGDFPWFQQKLSTLAQKDPARFAALLEFALKKHQEYLSAAVRH